MTKTEYVVQFLDPGKTVWRDWMTVTSKGEAFASKSIMERNSLRNWSGKLRVVHRITIIEESEVTEDV